MSLPPDLIEADPKGLIRESYRIEGISDAECRSIFLDWALSLPAGLPPQRALSRLIMAYGLGPDHPMTAILYEGLADPAPATPPKRRGGARARRD
ncbi:hypothetical protein ACEYYB_00140 [Paracoccus sp. p4-l81]|uniref:hypothetical protein n=1 Tax=unclassified Paracoccus (in: a-proteobacteria) TaxID=2688777 RepID=UPI0035B90FEB